MSDTPMVQVANGDLKFSQEGLAALVAEIDGPTQEVNPTEKEAGPTLAKEEPEEPTGEEAPKKEPDDKPVKTKIQGVKVKGELTDLELDPDELKEYVQKGAHYTQEMQALRDKERNLTPYEALIRQLQTDPALSQHIADYYQRGKAPKAEPQDGLDPIDLLKQEIKRETIQEMQQQFIQPISHQQVIDRVQATVQRDPMYQEVQAEILRYVQEQPQSVGQMLFRELDQNPKAYMDMFQATKERLEKTKQTKTETPLPEPVKKETKAPILETSGNTDAPEPSETKQRARIDKLKAKALQSGNTDDLASFIKEGGFIDHLL
jgi:hypothetical protein